MRAARGFAIVLLCLTFLLFPLAAALAQSPAASPGATPTSAPSLGNWTKYMAWALGGITVMVSLMALVGLGVQGPGFRKIEPEE